MKSKPRLAGFPTELSGYVPVPEWLVVEADEKRRRRASDEFERRSPDPVRA